MSTSRKIRRRHRRRRSLEEIAIHQVELMLKAERKLRRKRPLKRRTLRRRAQQFHARHFA